MTAPTEPQPVRSLIARIDPEPDPALGDFLADLCRKWESGDLCALAIVTLNRGRYVGTGWSPNSPGDVYRLLGGLAELQQRILRLVE